MLETITAEDLAASTRELLEIKYADPGTRAIRDKLVRNRPAKILSLTLAPLAPLVCELKAESFTVTTGEPARSDLRVAIPMADLLGLFRRRIPLGSLLRGRIRFRGSIRDTLLVGKLLQVEVGDPAAAFAFFRHYFLEQ